MHAISTDALRELGTLASPPCLSLYQPTHRKHPDKLQDRLTFKRSIDVLYAALIQRLKAHEAQNLLLPFHRLADDADFWSSTLDGLAVFASPMGFRAFSLPHKMPAYTQIDDVFYTTPMRRLLQSVDRYQVLCISRDHVRLFEGNRDALEELTLAPEATLTSGSTRRCDGTAWDGERSFRALDLALMKHHSKPSGLPLILAALPEHQQRFRQVSQNICLLPVGLDVHPGAMNIRALSIMAWHVVEPQHNARQQVWIDAFVVAKAQGRGCDDVRTTAAAAARGRVGLLLIDPTIQADGDLLDNLAELVESTGGVVRVISTAHMPTFTGLAAAMRA